MRFTWSTKYNSRNSTINVRDNYKKITQKFCEHYYHQYDKNFPSLGYLYKPNSMFTFIDTNIIGFRNLCKKLQSNGIYKIVHHNVNVCSQPMGADAILISVNGTLTTNNNFSPSNFTETIILKKDPDNRFYIYQTIFNILDDNNIDLIDIDIRDFFDF